MTTSKTYAVTNLQGAVWPPDLPLPALLLAMDSALAREEAGWATEPPPEVDFADWLESVCGWRSKA